MFSMTQYLSQEKYNSLTEEKRVLQKEQIPETAKRIDDARQMGDLSENAEYHAAREQMAWIQSRLKEIEFILNNFQILNGDLSVETISIGNTIILESNGKEKTYVLVGAQEADPLQGRISNESPLGEAFLGKREGDTVEVKVPAGLQTYTVKKIS